MVDQLYYHDLIRYEEHCGVYNDEQQYYVTTKITEILTDCAKRGDVENINYIGSSENRVESLLCKAV